MRNKSGNNLKIVLLAVFSLLMPTLAGVVIGVRGITDQDMVYLIQFVAISIGCLILLIIVKFGSFSFHQLGFTRWQVKPWMVGLVLIEAVALAFGFHSKMSLKTVGLLVLFMTSVGFFEELIYRGLVLQYLKMRGSSPRAAIIISACLFGGGHLINILGGADVKMTVVQMIFALLFGIVCAEMVVVTKNITIGIAWHGIHNILDQLTAHPSTTIQLLIVSIQCGILVILAGILWKKIKDNLIVS